MGKITKVQQGDTVYDITDIHVDEAVIAAQMAVQNAQAAATAAAQIVTKQQAMVIGNDVLDFDSSKTYYVNDLCWYNNKLYRCTIQHAPSPFNANEFVVTSLTAEYLRMHGLDVETIVVNVSSNDGLLDVSTTTVTVNVLLPERTLTLTPDSNGDVTFVIEKGLTYNVSFSNATGYITPSAMTLTATLETRPIYVTYKTPESSITTETCNVLIYMLNTANAVTAADKALLIGQYIHVSYTDGTEFNVEIDADLHATFEVPYGKTYSIEFPTVSGYRRLNREFKFTAGLPNRWCSEHYREIQAGLFLVDKYGELYDINRIEQVAVEDVVAISLRTSALGDNVITCKLPFTYAGKQWASANVEFDKNVLPFIGNATLAQADMNGVENTTKMIGIAGGIPDVTTPAAEYARSQQLALTLQGVVETFSGSIMSAGQIWQWRQNYAAIYDMVTAIGMTCPNFLSGNWWSSSQNSAPSAWYLYNGSLSNGYRKTYSHQVLPFFDF